MFEEKLFKFLEVLFTIAPSDFHYLETLVDFSRIVISRTVKNNPEKKIEIFNALKPILNQNTVYFDRYFISSYALFLERIT